jgi:hypothetical protein
MRNINPLDAAAIRPDAKPIETASDHFSGAKKANLLPRAVCQVSDQSTHEIASRPPIGGTLVGQLAHSLTLRKRKRPASCGAFSNV